MSLVLNNKIPPLAVGFARSRDLLGGLIAACRGGVPAIFNNNFPTHAFLYTQDSGCMFATEEGSAGLVEDCLCKYTDENNRIVSVLYWRGWDDAAKSARAETHLAQIRSAGGSRAAYGYSILPYFLPLIGNWFKPKPETLVDGSEICSEDVAGIHICDGGVTWLSSKLLAPDQLYAAMVASKECAILPPYLS